MNNETGYIVDRVVICDAYREPDKHYKLLSGGRSELVKGQRRPSVRFLISARETRGGIAGMTNRNNNLFEDMLASAEQCNDFVNQLRDEVRAWRENGYPGTAFVTRRLLEWWFERDEERKAIGKRFFFCQQEAIETVIYLYEVKNRLRMPETGDFIRYALKLATGTGKTVVMALIITWSNLHKRKVSGSTLSGNFLLLVPNLTVRDRVWGVPRGDGLEPAGTENLYEAFDMIPPEYQSEFHPNILVKNWQAIPLESEREDWIANDMEEDGRFIPASVVWALQRRRQQDPNTSIRKMLKGWQDLVVINDEAHHAYGQKKTRKGEEPEYIKWSKIIERIAKITKNSIGLIADLSATPWYGSGSPKPEGTLFEWLVSDFSVYDAFESGLVKVVRLPDPDDEGRIYLDVWDHVKGANTKEEYLSGCRGAIASIYASWKQDFETWQKSQRSARGPSPVMLVVTSDATKAEWVFEHLIKDFDLLHNSDEDDPKTWVTIQINSRVFDADKGNEAVLREMVNTVGKEGKAGEHVRCIVSVNMLSEGWDVKSVTHILGLRAFGSPLLTEQVIGRGLRLTNYQVLNQPLEERPEGTEETVDTFGIPFVGFPIEKRKRARTGKWGQDKVWIEKDDNKREFRIQIPNVRSWAVGMSQPLHETVRADKLPELVINPKETPPTVRVRPVVGGAPEEVLTLEQFRAEYPLLRSKMIFARELYEVTNASEATALGVGPTFDELLELADGFTEKRVQALGESKREDIGIYYWSRKALDILETAVREAPTGTTTVPILGTPDYLDTENLRRFQWAGIWAKGKKCHTNKVPCHTDLERQFADFLDDAKDVIRYFKNERFGFSITYYENKRPRQYYPDFIVAVRESENQEVYYLAETKGEMRHSTRLKKEAAELWCEKMSGTSYGMWRYLLVPQPKFEKAMANGVRSFQKLLDSV